MTLGLTLGLLLTAWARVSNAQENSFLRLDRNRDQVISRWEWSGNPLEFSRLDHNHDGLLTQSEYLRLQETVAVSGHYGSRDAFSLLDRDNNRLLQTNEWTGNPNDFYRLDDNWDGALSRSEFFGRDYERWDRRFRDNAFAKHDSDRNGVIDTREWRGKRADFYRRDANRDRRISREEFYAGFNLRGRGYGYGSDEFARQDLDRNGTLASNEFRGSHTAFHDLDVDRDELITREEYYRSAPSGGGYYGGDSFTQMDLNRDGVLSSAEFRGSLSAFHDTDINRDGVVTREEFSRGVPSGDYGYGHGYGSNDFARMDSNRDGVLNSTEFRGSLSAFHDTDINRDGVVTREEFYRVNTSGGSTQEYQVVDIDGDGTISLGEWRYDRQSFEELDRNNDGRLSRAELEWYQSYPRSRKSQTIQAILDAILIGTGDR